MSRVPQRLLYGLSISPWTIKARWALDWHGLDYAFSEYVPMLSALRLRLRLRNFASPVTVPVLFTRESAITDSFDIALYAEHSGAGEPLIAHDTRAQIDRWNALANRICEAGRALVMGRLATQKAGQVEALPAFVPSALRPHLTFIAKQSTRYFREKYAFEFGQESTYRRSMAEGLEQVRSQLAANHAHGTLLPRFSFADVAIVSTLQLIEPCAERFVPIKPATRELWTQESLASEFSDLLAWRDSMLDRYFWVRPTAT